MNISCRNICQRICRFLVNRFERCSLLGHSWIALHLDVIGHKADCRHYGVQQWPSVFPSVVPLSRPLNVGARSQCSSVPSGVWHPGNDMALEGRPMPKAFKRSKSLDGVLLLDCSRLQFKVLTATVEFKLSWIHKHNKRLPNSCQATCNADINISTNFSLGEMQEKAFADRTWLACEAPHGTDPFIIPSCWHWPSQSFSLCLQALIAEYGNNAPASQNINLEVRGNENALAQTSERFFSHFSFRENANQTKVEHCVCVAVM